MPLNSSTKILTFLFAIILWAGSLVGQVIVEDNFDAYAGNDAAFEAAWAPPVGTNLGIVVPRTVAPFPPAPWDGSGDAGIVPPIDPFDSPAITFPEGSGGINEWTGNLSVRPSETQAVRLSADILESGHVNRRFSVGLRDSTNVANLVELGFWNADAIDPTDGVTVIPTTAYAYRAILFGAPGGNLIQNPNWQYFQLPEVFDDPLVDHNGDGRVGNGDGLVGPFDVGSGWHRYSATISLTEVTFEIDLFRDGSIDATQTWELEYNSAGTFDSLRIGGPSGVGMNQFTSVDNIVLELIDLGGGPNCDFDGSTTCDVVDLDLLYAQLGTTNPGFDVDGNGSVDNADIGAWLTAASAADPQGRTFVPGDANLDGSVGGGDFTTLASNFGAGNAGWGQGNFDGNTGGSLNVGGSDFTALASSFGFTSLAAVPEPCSAGLLSLGLLALATRRRRLA